MIIDLYQLMNEAIREAEKGLAENEVPVGAVLAGPDGEIIAKAHNRPIALHDPTAHAEILAIRQASRICRNYRLTGTTLVVTLEPCLMCMGAAVHARIGRLVFGAYDPKGGAAGSLYDIADDERLSHRIQATPGILKEECRSLMQAFFRSRRNGLGKID